jgi:preprotein translocase subunit YajC
MSSDWTLPRTGSRRIKEFPGLESLGAVLPLVLLAALGYFLLIRPTRRRAQEVSAIQNALGVDAEVMLTSGIFGRVTAIEDEQVLVEISPGVVVRVHRGAIGKIVTPANEPDDQAEPLDEAPPLDEPRDSDATADPGAEHPDADQRPRGAN